MEENYNAHGALRGERDTGTSANIHQIPLCCLVILEPQPWCKEVLIHGAGAHALR